MKKSYFHNYRKSVIVKYTACGSTFIADWFSQSLYNDEELSGYLNTTQERNNDKVGTVGPLTNNFYQLIDYLSLKVPKHNF